MRITRAGRQRRARPSTALCLAQRYVVRTAALPVASMGPSVDACSATG